jgi:hypothetical protein
METVYAASPTQWSARTIPHARTQNCLTNACLQRLGFSRRPKVFKLVMMELKNNAILIVQTDDEDDFTIPRKIGRRMCCRGSPLFRGA